MVGFGLVMPVLPKLIETVSGRDLAGASLLAGWLFFAYGGMQFLFGPVIGNLSDAYGRRPVLLLSVAGLAVDYLLTAFAPTMIWLFVGRIVAGLCGASYTTANAYLADITTPENRAKAFGLMGAAFGLGFIIGPAIGGLLGEFGPRVPFLGLGIFLSFPPRGGRRKELLHRDGLRQIPGLVHIGTDEDGGVVGDELDGNRIQKRADEGVGFRHADMLEEVMTVGFEALIVR